MYTDMCKSLYIYMYMYVWTLYNLYLKYCMIQKIENVKEKGLVYASFVRF